MYKAYRTKLKLNKQERTLIAQHAGFGRWVYNWGLRMWIEAYKEGLKPTANKLKKFFTNHVKPNYPWMSELSAELVIADRFYPSSQLCSKCGSQQKMPLSERVYNCSCCGMSRNRDYNAAINLSKTSGSGGLACGVGAADSPQ